MNAFSQVWDRKAPEESSSWTVLAGITSFLCFLILVTWALSLARTWTQEGLLLVSAGAWSILGLCLGAAYDPCFLIRRWRETRARWERMEVFAAAVIGTLCAGNLVRIYLLPPLNVDSFYVHLARAYYWFYEPYVGIIENYYSIPNIYPITVHLLFADWLKVTGSDRLVECVSLFSYAGLFLATRSVLARSGVARATAALGGLLVVSMPVVVVCSITTQVDVPSLFFYSLALYFCFCSVHGAAIPNLVLAGLACGLAIGSKPQGAVAGGVLLVCVAVILVARRVSPAKLAVLAGTAVLLASPGYIFTWWHTGSVFPLKMHEAGFSMARFFDNWSRVYPQIVFRFPFAPTARSGAQALSFFDHDESNFGPAFTVLSVLAIAPWFWRRKDARSVECRILATVLICFLLFMSSTWQQREYHWDVRLLVYGAYTAFLMVIVRLRWEFKRRTLRLGLAWYAAASLLVISMLDSRSGVRTLWRAVELPEDQRSFAHLSPIGIKPPAFFQSVMDESHLPDGGVALIKLRFAGDALGILFGDGPKRPAYYLEGNDHSESGLAALIAKCEEYVVRKRCRWLLVDFALSRLSGYLAGKPALYRPVLVDSAYAILYHVDAPEQLGRRDQVHVTELKVPELVALTPTSGSGRAATFSLTYAEPNPGADLTRQYLMINDVFRYEQGCVLRYDPKENLLWLLNDSGVKWLGPEIPGDGKGALSNAQCSLSGAAATMEKAGQNVTIKVPVTFHAKFAGKHQLFVTGQDSLGLDTGWQAKGSWTVP